MKAILMHDCLNSFPDLNLSFGIYTDASEYKLGAGIIQNSQSIVYYSRMLMDSKNNYTKTEKRITRNCASA